MSPDGRFLQTQAHNNYYELGEIGAYSYLVIWLNVPCLHTIGIVSFHRLLCIMYMLSFKNVQWIDVMLDYCDIVWEDYKNLNPQCNIKSGSI